jgi:hypothetical protein
MPGSAAGRGLLGLAAGQPQPGVDLRRTGAVEQHVVDAPLAGQRRQAALGEDREQRRLQAGRAQQAAQRAGLREVAAGVDQHRVGGRRVDQDADVGGGHAHLVAQQGQGGQDVAGRRHRVGEEQQACHGGGLRGRKGQSGRGGAPLPRDGA